MKRRMRTAALLVAGVLALCALPGCANPGANAPDTATAAPVSGKAVSVTDMMGRAVELPAPATRIVALSAAECEILYAIGAGDALVGRGAYCDYPPEALALPEVQSGRDTNVEQILALSPSLVFTSDMEQAHGQLEQLESGGVRVAIADAHTVDEVYTALALAGALTGRESEAAAVAEGMRARFSEAAARAAGTPGTAGKRVYFEVSPLAYGLWTAGSGTFMNELAELMGLVNCFADVEGWAEISEEQVLARDPDYIVTVAMFGGEALTPDAEILARPGWQNVTAVRTGGVLWIGDDALARPGPRLADGAQRLCDFICGTAAKTP